MAERRDFDDYDFPINNEDRPSGKPEARPSALARTAMSDPQFYTRVPLWRLDEATRQLLGRTIGFDRLK